MKLKSVRLQNFRCFKDITIDFHDQLTVLVGGNGSGKSAVLDAIAPELVNIVKACVGIFHKSQYEPSLPPPFLMQDVHKKNKDNLPIFDFELVFPEDKIENQVVFGLNAHGQLKVENDSYYRTLINRLKPLPKNPVFVYYPAKRLVKDTRFDKLATKAELSAAYKNMLEQEIDVKTSLAWFDSKDAEQARERDEQRTLGNGKDYFIPELLAVKESIERILPKYIHPRMKWTPAELVVSEKDNPENVVSLAQLSDGYRTMLALVMDLARRMAVANAESFNEHNKSVLESSAVVLIDEVDLHLHPSWQQRVLPDLLRTFPNTQFIVTTHSPQVLSSVKPENVRILEAGKVLPVETSTFGAESSRVLEEVFGVSTRPENEAKKELESYFALINKGEGKSAKGQKSRSILNECLHDDPILDRADMFIARKQREKEREAGLDA